MSPEELSGPNGRLSALLDAAAFNQALDKGADGQAGADQHVRDMKVISGMVASIAGKVPVVGDVAGPSTGEVNTLVANYLMAPTVDIPKSGLPDTYSPTGGQVETANTLSLIEALQAAHHEHPGTYPGFPGGVPDFTKGGHAGDGSWTAEQIDGWAHKHLDDYFAKNGVGASDRNDFGSTFTNNIGDNYEAVASKYTINQDGNAVQNMDHFLNDNNWRR